MIFQLANYPTENNQVHAEDFDFDFRSGDYLFDVSDLEMSIYVYPLPQNFNPSMPMTTRTDRYVGTVQTEFRQSMVTAYQYVGGRVSRVEFDAAAQAALAQVQATVGQAVPGSYSGISHAQRFGLGFLHDQFQSLFGSLSDPADGAAKLWLSDNFADLESEIRTPVFALDFSLGDIGASDDDFQFRATTYHVYRDWPGSDEDTREIQAYPSGRFAVGWAYVIREIEPGASTPWLRLGTWNVGDCDWLSRVRIRVRLLDPGVFYWSTYGPIDFEQTFDCAQIRQLAQQGEWGIVDEVTDGLFFEELDPPDPPIVVLYHQPISAQARARVILTTR